MQSRPPLIGQCVLEHQLGTLSSITAEHPIKSQSIYARSLEFGQKAIDLDLLRKLLPDSWRHTFIASNVSVRSAIRAGKTNTPQSVKCWTFKFRWSKF